MRKYGKTFNLSLSSPRTDVGSKCLELSDHIKIAKKFNSKINFNYNLIFLTFNITNRKKFTMSTIILYLIKRRTS